MLRLKKSKKNKKLISVENIGITKLNRGAYLKLIKKYYKGPQKIRILFNNKNLDYYGFHSYIDRYKTHIIEISYFVCKRAIINGQMSSSLMNEYDCICRIIQVTLHELIHARQCDRDNYSYHHDNGDIHKSIKDTNLKYQLSILEAEAEGFSLLNFNKALNYYHYLSTKDNDKK